MSARCWLCDQDVIPPVEIIGRWYAGTSQIVHRSCLGTLTRLELEFDEPDTKDAA